MHPEGLRLASAQIVRGIRLLPWVAWRRSYATPDPEHGGGATWELWTT